MKNIDFYKEKLKLNNQQEVFKPYVSELGCPVADEFLERHFSLPMYIELSDENVEEICNIVKSCK